MNESLAVHTLKQFRLTDISKVWLALINISDTITYNEYIALNRVYPAPNEPFIESSHGYLKYEIVTSGKTNFIFNSILIFNDREEMLCYTELDPQNLSTVDSWVVKISASYDMTSGSSNYYIDYLGIYKEHAQAAVNDLAVIHNNLNLDEVMTVSQARRYAGTDITTGYIEQTINTVSTTLYDSVERLVVPAKQEDGQNSLIKRYLNNRSKPFKYQSLCDDTLLQNIDGIENTTILPSKIVDAVSTGTLLTYFLPRIAYEAVNVINDSTEQENQISYNDFARSYKYGSIYVDQETGAGFFLPIYKHTDSHFTTEIQDGMQVQVPVPASKQLVGCMLIPNGIDKTAYIFKFLYLKDKSFDFNRIAPKYIPMTYMHVIQFKNGDAVCWNKNLDTYDLVITDTENNESLGIENPWVYLNKGTGIKTPAEQATSFVLKVRSLNIQDTQITNIYTTPSMATANIYLARLTNKGPVDYLEFKNYCLHTRDVLQSAFTSAEGSSILRSVPRNYISYRILSEAAETRGPDNNYIITEWSKDLTSDIFTYRASGNVKWFVETSVTDGGGKELFNLTWDEMLSHYTETFREPNLWDEFANFVNSHSGVSQSLYFPIGIDQGDPGELPLDSYPEIPEFSMDTIDPTIQENTASRNVINQIGHGVKSQVLIMAQDISEAVNAYACRSLVDYEDDFGQVAENIDLEIMPCDNGILEVRDDTSAVYVTVIKYSGKANNKVFRQVISKELLDENNGLDPYFNVSYSNNILCYRMKLKSGLTYTSFYDITKVNPFTPILSNVDKFICTEDRSVLSYRICTLYHGYGMLFETEYHESISEDDIYSEYQSNSGSIINTHGRKLIRREYFLPDD